jgi:hypothetical protein
VDGGAAHHGRTGVPVTAYLSFGVLAYVLGAGFTLGILLAWGIRSLDGRRIGGPEGGKLITISRRQEDGCEIIQLAPKSQAS